ncbi:MAG: hypothetical protein P4L84_35485 [Isosphaeraceae bacterium]|nr:hypothetical protein [Isosphaeraceae bacterium]
MTVKEVGALLGYSNEKVETLINDGLTLPTSGSKVKLDCTRVGNDIDISDDQFDAFAAKCEKEEPSRWPPVDVRRILLVEARHRCAICRNTAPPQFHHMLDWARLNHHDTEHMLVLCGTCHSLCSNGQIDYKSQLAYKKELQALNKVISPKSKYRIIEDSEQRLGLSEGQRALIRALSEEFGCEVKLNVRVACGERWFNLDAAVVRGEDLIAIQLYECRSGGIPLFQIEGLLDIAKEAKLDEFQKFVLFVAVVSNADQKVDEDVLAELRKLKTSAPIEFDFRWYRRSELRRKYRM